MIDWTPGDTLVCVRGESALAQIEPDLVELGLYVLEIVLWPGDACTDDPAYVVERGGEPLVQLAPPHANPLHDAWVEGFGLVHCWGYDHRRFRKAYGPEPAADEREAALGLDARRKTYSGRVTPGEVVDA